MITKKILNHERLRRIDGGFAFIPHRFITEGFLSSLSQHELLLYFFLILVSDRYGLSFYSYNSICNLLNFYIQDFLEARIGLIKKDLVAFDDNIFQVLELPAKPVIIQKPSKDDPATIHYLIRQSLNENKKDHGDEE